MKARVLVTGKNGQLGQSLQGLADQSELELVFVDRQQLDLANNQSIKSYFAAQPPFAAIINAAAYTAVDQAESEPDLAEQVNSQAVAALAAVARRQDSFLLQVSTDYVFDGRTYRPWQETDPTGPLNVYGRSKLAGEQALLASGCRGAVVRTSWLYSQYGHNFVRSILHLAQERSELSVVADQIGAPTWAADLAQALLKLVQHELQQLSPSAQLYHYSNAGVCSWYDFATAIVELADLPCRVLPISSAQYPSPAQRPYYSLLDSSKIRQQLSLDIAHWRQSLATCLAALPNN